jgi:hypothetical protein
MTAFPGLSPGMVTAGILTVWPALASLGPDPLQLNRIRA